MWIIKQKKSLEEKIAEVKERIDESCSIDVRNYYRGVLEGLEYAARLVACPYEYEEVIELGEAVND